MYLSILINLTTQFEHWVSVGKANQNWQNFGLQFQLTAFYFNRMVYVFELAEIEDSNIFEGKTSSAAFLFIVLEVKKKC